MAIIKNFLVVEGIDGCGKGYIIRGLAKLAEAKGYNTFDIRQYQIEHNQHPPLDILNNHKILLSCEPTHAGIGNQIRQKLIRKGTTHTAIDIAIAYAEDRLLLHEQVIIPASKQGKLILQERNLASSLVYQPTHARIHNQDKPTVDDILSIEGNKFCLENAPEFLVLAVVKPETGMERLTARVKDDKCEYERLNFQKEVGKGYESKWFKDIWEKAGSKVIYFDAEGSLEDADRKIKILFNEHLKERL